MTTIDDAGVTSMAAPALTFKERLARARKELEADAVFDLEVPWYPDLWATYRVLGFEEIRSVGIRVEAETQDQVTAERLTAAQTLAESCLELKEFRGYDDKGKPILEGTGYRWSAAAARELFGVELPEGVEAPDAVIAIFPYPRDMLMMNHFQEYLAAGMSYMPEIERVLQGESPAASAATTSDSLLPPQLPEST
jgi:hypothetical protein